MSSSSSCARAGDILDLDKYMRSNVRPPHQHTRDRFVVDAGGADRVPLACSSVDSMRSPRPREYSKRYSHDSGLSDESYVKRRHRSHRRTGEAKRVPSRFGSKSSVLQFRAACQQALREQQEQIARVAELCQKLAQPQHASQNISSPANCPAPNQEKPKDQTKQIYTDHQATQSLDQSNKQPVKQTGPNLTKHNFSQNVKPIQPSDSSDVSSSSRSSKDFKRKEKLRSDSCKTYKIIMNKLDELNHLFAARRSQPAHSSLISPRRAPIKPTSSECVSVSNKLVATDDLRMQKNQYSPTIQAFPVHTRINRNCEGHSARLSSCRGRFAVSRAHDVDIAPAPHGDSKCEGGKGEGWNEAPQDFDLDDPLRFYAQAKRMQALHIGTRAKHSNRTADKLDNELDGKSLCALCRFYWRALRRCLTQQLFGACS